MFVLEKEGKVKPGTAKEWVNATPNHGRDLPEHVKKKPKRKGK